jgi:7,8-dihydropterin-6-yl-methyl-4-(beta-D-ribofuranosyl)aminobenzene 5'-phosphate synthase
VETPRHHILFDAGANALFLENAEVLGVSIPDIDVFVLSHGHYDHGGGLELFCKRNSGAKILLPPGAFTPRVAEDGDGTWEDIGLDARLEKAYAARFATAEGKLDDELLLFSDVTGRAYVPHAPNLLEQTQSGTYEPDLFSHEQNLLISADGKVLLLAGCGHRGIVNILNRAEEYAGREPDYVVGGFHLRNPGLGIDEPREVIEAVAAELKRREKTQYITGHCTGEEPYKILQAALGDRITDMAAGKSFTL